MENLVLSRERLLAIRKSLVDSLTVASGAKSSATYYHSRDEQVASIKRQVDNLYSLSKELPLIVANQRGVTGTYISEVLLNEFKKTANSGACNIVNPIDWYDHKIGDKALLGALNKLNEDSGITYVLRMFIKAKEDKVNNERFRKIVLGFIWGQSNLEFYALKYRNKIREILKHVYGVRKTSILLSIAKNQVRREGLYANDKELGIARENLLKYYVDSDIKAYKLLLFIFKEDQGVKYKKSEFPFLNAYNKAKKDITNITNLPEEIITGLISNKNHPQYAELWGSKLKREATKRMIRENVKVTSVNQQVRQTRSTEKLGASRTVEYAQATDFLALYKTGYENGFSEEIEDAIDALAEKNKIGDLSESVIGVIVDTSNSMKGHEDQSKNTPKAIVEFTAKVLEKSAKKAIIVETEGISTDLATALVKLLKKQSRTKFDSIFVLTDGYENTYDGLFNEVLEAYQTASNDYLPVFQVSPIVGAEMGANVRKIGDSVTTFTINNPKALQAQMAAKMLEIDTKRWLDNQIKLIEKLNVSRNKMLNSVNA